MEYYKDLLENDFHKKRGSKSFRFFNIIFGVALLIFAFFYIRVSPHENDTLNIVIGSIFIANGVICTLRGINFNIEKIFGKAFIKINNSNFTLKINPYKKAEQSILWKDIKSMNYTGGKFTFLKKDGKIVIFSVSELSYVDIQEIKKTVSNYAELNDITQE